MSPNCHSRNVQTISPSKCFTSCVSLLTPSFKAALCTVELRVAEYFLPPQCYGKHHHLSDRRSSVPARTPRRLVRLLQRKENQHRTPGRNLGKGGETQGAGHEDEPGPVHVQGHRGRSAGQRQGDRFGGKDRRQRTHQ